MRSQVFGEVVLAVLAKAGVLLGQQLVAHSAVKAGCLEAVGVEQHPLVAVLAGEIFGLLQQQPSQPLPAAAFLHKEKLDLQRVHRAGGDDLAALLDVKTVVLKIPHELPVVPPKLLVDVPVVLLGAGKKFDLLHIFSPLNPVGRQSR